MSESQTAIMEKQARFRLVYALDRLLCELKPFMRAYPRVEDDKMPDHDLEWITYIGSDPRQAIVNALKVNPELWLQAIPSEVCVLSRKELEAMTNLTPEDIALLVVGAESIIATLAAKYSHEMATDGER